MDIEITGLPPERVQEIAAAFTATQRNGRPDGMADGEWAKRCLINFIRSVVFAYRKEPFEAQARITQQSVIQDFQ